MSQDLVGPVPPGLAKARQVDCPRVCQMTLDDYIKANVIPHIC